MSAGGRSGGGGPLTITIDTSVINARGSLPDMNRIERWHAEGRVALHTPPPVIREARTHRCAKGRALYAGKAAAFRKGRRAGPGRGKEGGLAPGEAAAILFPHTRPHAMTVSQRRDAEILSAHHRLRHDVLLTLNSRHFIRGGRRERLARDFGIRVMTPAELVALAGRESGFLPGGDGGRID